MANETSDLQLREKEALAAEGTRPGTVFRPDVDILERPDAYLVYADMPGVDDRHVHIRLENGVLSLDAEQVMGPEAGWNPLHAEYRSGGYHREFRLSEGIDEQHVSASMRDGVLELRLPKSERHKPRQITVQAG
ncbi:MAG: Hsp20/alpha crystallin family protein [Myxococcota bacterium]|nr:Hsp20/alpha crystallin family protein [Myxococcota bacterium]